MSIYGRDDASMYSYPSAREASEFGTNYSQNSPTQNVEEGSSSNIDKTLLDPIEQTRTLALINLFSTRTADFLNGQDETLMPRFSKSVETKLQDMDKQLHELETTVLLYEKKLDSLPPQIFEGVQPVEFAPVTYAPEGIAPPPSGYAIAYQGSNVQQTLQPAPQPATTASAIPTGATPSPEAPPVEQPPQPQPVEEELTEEEKEQRAFLERLENDEELAAKWDNYTKLYKIRINILQLEHKIKSEGEDIRNLRFMDLKIRQEDRYLIK